MRPRYTISSLLACSIAITFSVATTVVAQQEKQRNEDGASRQQDQTQERQQSQSQRSDTQRSDAQRQTDEQKNRQNQADTSQGRQASGELKITPQGWVRVATDYDNDGTFDAFETIYYYDLERARQSSRDRSNRDAQASSRSTTSNERESQPQQQERITGKIQELRRESLAGTEGEHLIARITSDDQRTAKVCLGTTSQLSKLNLSEGDRITVQGVRGRINDKSMLMARQVTSNGNQVSIEMPASRQLKRVRGEIVSTRETTFRGRDEDYVVATIDIANGKQETVNLGPKSKLTKLKLQKGDQVSLLVRPGRINGQSAMIAEQVSANGTVVELPRDDQSTLASTQGASNDRVERAFRGESSGRDEDRQTNSRRDRTADDRVTFNGQERAALGVTLSHSTQQGVSIEKVISESPAEDAGLRQGDQIVAVGGQEVSTYQDVIRALRDHDPDESINIRIRRDGRIQNLSASLSTRAEVFDGDQR